MNRIFTAIVLLLVAGCALADATNISNMVSSESSALTNPPLTDYSVAYLSQIFGNVGDVLHGTSGQILGKMFDILNKGIMVVTALWLGYTTCMLALRAAQEGSFLGQNKNVPVLFLRIAFGFILIIPSSTTGYSLLQDAFMKVVVAGVALADQTWSAALNYMQYGGSLYIKPSGLSLDKDMVSRALLAHGGGGAAETNTQSGYITKLLMSEVCMLTSKSTASPTYTPPTFSTTGAGSQAAITVGGGTISFPSYSNSVKTPGGCGTITSYFNAQVASGAGGFKLSQYTQAQIEQMANTSFAAMQSLVTKMLDVAQCYVGYPGVNTSVSANQKCTQSWVGKATFSALLSYAGLMSTYQTALTQSGNQTGVQQHASDFMGRARAQGWIMAGRFYWDVENANADAAAINLSKLMPSVTLPPGTNEGQANGHYPPYILSSSQNPPTPFLSNLGQKDSIMWLVSSYWLQYVGAQQSAVDNTLASQSSSNSGNQFANAAAGQATAVMSRALGNFGGPGAGQDPSQYNPIALLMQMGRDLLNAAVGIWIGVLVLSFGIGLIAGICQSTSPAGLAWKSVLAWIKTLINTICFLILIPGAILAYYVPMYPFAVYTFAAVGWIFTVIEGMAAAPLVCMGLTHPEGHDFLGKAEQALMLFLGIFLRPALMVIGLIAAMIVSFVAFKMMYIGFQGVITDLSSQGPSAFGDDFLLPITQALILVIFGMLTMELVEQCFKLIYQLPNNIMRWIGGPQMGEEYGQMAQAIKGAVSAGGQGIQEGMKGTAQSVEESGSAITGLVGEARKGGKVKGNTNKPPPKPPAK